jgi:hypothetical protein
VDTDKEIGMGYAKIENPCVAAEVFKLKMNA